APLIRVPFAGDLYTDTRAEKAQYGRGCEHLASFSRSRVGHWPPVSRHDPVRALRKPCRQECNVAASERGLGRLEQWEVWTLVAVSQPEAPDILLVLGSAGQPAPCKLEGEFRKAPDRHGIPELHLHGGVVRPVNNVNPAIRSRQGAEEKPLVQPLRNS